jgi:uncharacterized phage protein (TIGR02218 family)
MSKPFPTGLRAKLLDGCPTIAWLVLVRRVVDGVELGFTTHNRDLVVGSITYRARSAFEPSRIETSLGLSTDNQEIVGVLDSESISEDDIAAGLYAGARVTVAVIDWADASELGVIVTYVCGQITTDSQGRYRMELEGLQELLSRPQGLFVKPTCRHRFGGPGCGKNIEPLRVTATVTTTDGGRSVTASSLTQAAGYFARGVLRWESGPNAGRQVEVASHGAGGVLALWLDPPKAVAVGHTFSITPGCQLTFDACKGWNNAENFGGFPHVQGLNSVSQFPDAETIG